MMVSPKTWQRSLWTQGLPGTSGSVFLKITLRDSTQRQSPPLKPPMQFLSGTIIFPLTHNHNTNMAILKATGGGTDYRSYKLETLAPKGTFSAICIDCMESLEVERKKWQSEETESGRSTSLPLYREDQGGSVPTSIQRNEDQCLQGSSTCKIHS